MRRLVRRATLFLLVLLVVAAAVGSTRPAMATTIGGATTDIRYGLSQRKGFDTCAAPTQATMQTWWTNSPYYDLGIYIGGSNRGCSQPNLTKTWAENVHTQGWSYYLIWVGAQAPDPCTKLTFPSYMSYDATKARAEGAAEADTAVNAAYNLGFTGRNMYYYDMEGYTPTASGDLTTCRNVVKAFIDGWVGRIHSHYGEKAGVYGSTCNSYVNDWAGIANPPDAVWVADWNGKPSVNDVTASCLPDSSFTPDKRVHQYNGNINETWGSVTLNIDRDCSDALVTPHGHSTSDPACTSARVASVASVASMQLVTASQGWAMTDHGLVLTKDRGANWTNITPPQAASLQGTFFLNAMAGWTASVESAGEKAKMTVYRTGDGGQTWSSAAVPVSSRASGPVFLNFVDEQHGWAVVRQQSSSNFSFGELYRTTDGGATWTELKIPIGESVRFISETMGWTAGGPGGDKLYVTRDAGDSWQSVDVPGAKGLAKSIAYQLPSFTNSQNGVLPVTFAGARSGIAFFETNDGGQSWKLRSTKASTKPLEQGQHMAAAMVGADTWLAANPGGGLLITNNRGGQWQETGASSLPAGGTLTDVKFVSDQVGWGIINAAQCAGVKTDCTVTSELAQTIDGGKTWTKLTP